MIVNSATERSIQLQKIIRNKIKSANNFISFADFMELALYHPELGYYQQQQKIGSDFTTAPEISPLFTKCYAEQILEILTKSSLNQLLEIGPGTGTFARDLLNALQKQNIDVKYSLLEVSTGLKEQQAKTLQGHNVNWVNDVPEKFSGIIIANELLDAIPTHLFVRKENEIFEKGISVFNENLCWAEKFNPDFCKYFAALPVDLPANYTSEINFYAQKFIRKLLKHVQSGILIFSDYGYSREEYYHPERSAGTLTCFYKHTKTADPLQNIGLQDITAHVNFTDVAEIALDEGAQILGYTTQSNFLCNLEIQKKVFGLCHE